MSRVHDSASDADVDEVDAEAEADWARYNEGIRQEARELGRELQ